MLLVSTKISELKFEKRCNFSRNMIVVFFLPNEAKKKIRKYYLSKSTNHSYHNFIIVLSPPFWLIVRGITSITIGGNFVAREHLNFRVVRLTGRRCLLLFPFLLSSIYGIREKNWFPKKNLGATKLADFCDNMTIDDCDDGNAILDYLGNYDFQGVVHKVTDSKKSLTAPI